MKMKQTGSVWYNHGLWYEGEPFTFDPERRAVLCAELDARYAKLCGLNEQELTYILGPSAVYGPDSSLRILSRPQGKGNRRIRRIPHHAHGVGGVQKG